MAGSAWPKEMRRVARGHEGALGREIGERMYRLYGPTAEAVKIVEEAGR
jgi:hypothetical protein